MCYILNVLSAENIKQYNDSLRIENENFEWEMTAKNVVVNIISDSVKLIGRFYLSKEKNIS